MNRRYARPRARPALSGLLAILVALLLSRAAFATEHQNHLGLDGGYTYLNVNQKTTPDQGGGFGAHYTYGLTDAFNLTLELQHNIVALNQQLDRPTTPRDRPAYVSDATVGAQYVLDIVRWIPYGGILVGPYALGGGTIDALKFEFGAEVEVGLDYQLSRNFAVGLAYHEHFMLTALSTYPVFFNAFARVEYVWGW